MPTIPNLPDYGTASVSDTDLVVLWDGTTGVTRRATRVQLLSNVGQRIAFANGVPISSLTTTARNNVSSPPTGLLIWNSTTTQLEMYNGTAWVPVTGGKQTLTYGTTIATNASLGSYLIITVADTVGFTISAPSNPVAGARLTYEILNSSGDVMGTITWNAAFMLAGAFTNPASTKRRTITFRYNGANWVEECRAAADI